MGATRGNWRGRKPRSASLEARKSPPPAANRTLQPQLHATTGFFAGSLREAGLISRSVCPFGARHQTPGFESLFMTSARSRLSGNRVYRPSDGEPSAAKVGALVCLYG